MHPPVCEGMEVTDQNVFEKCGVYNEQLWLLHVEESPKGLSALLKHLVQILEHQESRPSLHH